METALPTIALIAFLAFLAEGTMEYLAKPWTKRLPDPWDDEVPKYVSLVLGILLCFVYRADLLALAGFQAIDPSVGIILTGIIVGRGSNFTHAAFKRLTGDTAMDINDTAPAAMVLKVEPGAVVTEAPADLSDRAASTYMRIT